MKTLLTSLALAVSVVSASQNWPALKITFGAFNDQPRTASEAEALGWVLMSSCEGKFLGQRYADPSEFSEVLIYDVAGYIAGVQSVLPTKYLDTNIVNPFANPSYQLDDWLGEEAYFTTAYFVDPEIICNGGRDSSMWESQGTGDRLLLQNGPTPDDLLSVPLTQDEADAEGFWKHHLCIMGMGIHYLTFDYTPDQDCDTVMPFQVLYDQGRLNGFAWMHEATLPGDKWEYPDAWAVGATVDSPPTCVEDVLNSVGLSTMHHYFYSSPWDTLCPLRHDRNLNVYKNLMTGRN